MIGAHHQPAVSAPHPFAAAEEPEIGRSAKGVEGPVRHQSPDWFNVFQDSWKVKSTQRRVRWLSDVCDPDPHPHSVS